MSWTVPATSEGTSIVALSVSSSRTGWSLASVSPGFTSTRTTSPAVTFSPSSGILNSVAIVSLTLSRVLLLRIDPEIVDRLRHNLRLDLAVLCQLGERRQRDVSRFDLEELAQVLPVLAAAEAVGAERADAARHPAVDRCRQHFQIIGGGDDGSLRAAEALRHVRHPRLLCRMEHVPAVARQRVAQQLVVAGDAPHV